MIVEYCQRNNCGKTADVVYVTNAKICLCARHYMDLVDSRELGAQSKKVNAALKTERENQEIMGRAAYAKHSFGLARQCIKGFGHTGG